jgi:hypothetical protein
MRKYTAQFEMDGHQQEQVRRGQDSLAVQRELAKNYPKATNIVATPRPVNREFKVRYKDRDRQREQMKTGRTRFEVIKSIRDKHPKAKSISVLPRNKH